MDQDRNAHSSGMTSSLLESGRPLRDRPVLDTIGLAQEALLVVALLVGAAAFRLLRLDRLPPGFHIDEAYNMLDALRILHGEWPIFLEANAGRDVLYSYPQAAMVALLGPHVYALRATSALIGISTVGLTYGFIRSLIRSRQVAALTALLLAGTFWHVSFSRFGIRAITLPLIEVLTFWFFWRGVRAGRALDYGLAGLFLGLGAYTHPAGRLVPIVLLAFAAYMVYQDRAGGHHYVRGLLITALAAIVVFLPLGVYFAAHPDAFLGHAGEVSVLTANSTVQGEVPSPLRGGTLTRLVTNTWRVIQMFTWRGDTRWWRNLAGRPVFDPVMGLAFVVGLGLLFGALGRPAPRPELTAGRRPEPVEGGVVDHAASKAEVQSRRGLVQPAATRDAAVFTLLVIGVMLLPTWLTDQAPNFSRAIGILPLVLVPPALALATIWRWATEHDFVWAKAAIVATMVVSLGWTAWDYFGTYAERPELYYAFDQDKVDIASYLRDAAAIDRVYTSQFLAGHPTVRFLTRDLNIGSFDLTQGLVVPSRQGDRGARYTFWARNPAHDGVPPGADERLAGIADRGAVVDAQGNLLLTTYRIPPGRLPADDALPATLAADLGPVNAVSARFSDVIELVGWSVAGDLEPGAGGVPEQVVLTLVWHCLAPLADNYTVFVHLVDQAGDQWGQHDKPPLGGTYPTSAWEPGDLIVDEYLVRLRSDAEREPTGGFAWRVGLYDPGTLERLPAHTTDGAQWAENAVVLR
jgi:4-amino-4-deoxy-L-arabinose transferase-like glycosyltransferase